MIHRVWVLYFINTPSVCLQYSSMSSTAGRIQLDRTWAHAVCQEQPGPGAARQRVSEVHTHTHTFTLHWLLLHRCDVTPSVWLIEVCRLSDGITWPSSPLTALYFMKVTLMNRSCSGSHFLNFIERQTHTYSVSVYSAVGFWCVVLKLPFFFFFFEDMQT